MRATFFYMAVMALCGTSVGLAQTPGASKAIDQSQAKFDEVLGKTAAFLKQGTYAVEVSSQWKSTGEAEGGSGASMYRLTVERPAKFRIEVQSAAAKSPELLCACDGQKVTTLLTTRAMFSQTPATAGLQNNTLMSMSLAGSGIDVLLQPNLVEFVNSQVTGVKHAKTVKAGKPLHHFRMQWAQGDLELWIAAEGDPLPQQFRRTIVVPAPGGAQHQLVTTTQWNWTVGKPVPAETFALTIPKDAQRVSDIYAALAGDDTASLIGQRLPELQLTKLDGTMLDLSTKDKAATVLIFWASWCAPSVNDLAGASTFVKQYTDRGAAFYAVNVGEPISDVRRFVAGKSLQSTVVLDAHGEASCELGVVDLPTAIVVDSHGKVKAIVRGSGKDVLLGLTKQLEDLVPKGQVADDIKTDGKSKR